MAFYIAIALLLGFGLLVIRGITGAEVNGLNAMSPGAQRNRLGTNILQAGSKCPGTDFYVYATDGHDSDADWDGKSWAKPLATVDHAVGKCTANKGDRIFVHPFHTETMAAADAVDIDVAGVSVIGVVQGRAMPTFNATHADADIKIASNNCSL